MQALKCVLFLFFILVQVSLYSNTKVCPRVLYNFANKFICTNVCDLRLLLFYIEDGAVSLFPFIVIGIEVISSLLYRCSLSSIIFLLERNEVKHINLSSLIGLLSVIHYLNEPSDNMLVRKKMRFLTSQMKISCFSHLQIIVLNKTY